MKVIQTEIPDVLIFEPKVFGDERGFFMESFNQKVLKMLQVGKLISYKIIILNQLKLYFAACIINYLHMLRLS